MCELTERQLRHWYTTWLAEVLEKKASYAAPGWDHGLHESLGPTPASVGRRLGLIDYLMTKACRDVRCRQFAEYRARRASDVATMAAALGGRGGEG